MTSDVKKRGLRKVISGGQSGVDQAALRAAKNCGLGIGGWCPPGRVCEKGVIPPEFPLKETPQERSVDAPHVPRSQRTEWNVRDSDGTLVMVRGEASHSEAATEDPGIRWTIECAQRYERPLLVCGVADSKARQKIREWLAENKIGMLNVAGPSESVAPGIGGRAFALLRTVLGNL